MNNSPNNKVVKKITDRLELGNKTFAREIPIDGTYGIVESLEECLDLSIYLAAKLVELEEREPAEYKSYNLIQQRVDRDDYNERAKDSSRSGNPSSRSGNPVSDIDNSQSKLNYTKKEESNSSPQSWTVDLQAIRGNSSE